MGAGACCAASFFCAHGHIVRREIEQRQLNDSAHLSSAVCRRIVRGPPVEQPLMGAEVEERELWGAERGARQAGVAYRLEVLVIILQLDRVGREGDGLVLHASASYHRSTP
jgi:hypothetical protein